MAQQLKLYGRQEMTKVMKRDREDYKEKKAGELLASKKNQARILAKDGHSVSLISQMLKISVRTVTMYLIEKY